jgi:hypothetical protein
MPRDSVTLNIGTRVKPRASEYRWHTRGRVDVAPHLEFAALFERRKLFGIRLIDAPKPAELALHTVVETVMVLIPRNKAIATDTIKGFDPLDNVHGERKARNPGSAGSFVSQEELRRRSILDACFGPEIID